MTVPTTPFFRANPATIILGLAEGEQTWIGAATWEQSSTGPTSVVTLEALGEDRSFPCSQLDEVAPQMWVGKLWNWDGTDGPSITVRPTQESDAVSSVTMGGFPRVPMPIPVIASLHASNGVFEMPKLYAMSDDDGFVVTMMLSTDAGLFVRYASLWHALNDEDAVDGLTVNEVDGTALDLFDQFDRAGQLVSVSAMPMNGEPIQPNVLADTLPEGEPAPTTEAVSASAVREVPKLDEASDLPEALTAALMEPDLRWWVERRAKALGLEPDFPWK